MAALLRRADAHPAVLQAARAARGVLPGDPRLGDELSTAEERPSNLLARHLAEVGGGISASRELGLTALQVWQALSESAGRGHGSAPVAILFTDLAEFSSWALEAGDDQALELLRGVAGAVEPAIEEGEGRIVKRLGDGHMAVFTTGQAAVEAALECQARVATIDVAGYRPRLRAGIHCGTPRRLGGDYLGVDVNIAARLVEAAGPGELFVSEVALSQVSTDQLNVKQIRRFRAKGTPRDLVIHAVSRR